MLSAAFEALQLIFEPARLMYLAFGVGMGLMLGLLPGVGGLVGMALLLPFTFAMDSYSAFAMLLGLAAVTPTSDTIPAVLFGVPGSAGSQATVLDGLPMAKRGEAGRALSAAYVASLMGGLFAACVLAFMLPVMKPVILFAGAPEMLALAAFGLSMVAILSGSRPLRGIAVASFGVMLAMVGASPQGGGIRRWTFESLYLWDGLPLVPVVLGLFAFPELCDLLISRTSLTSANSQGLRAGMITGFRDTIRNWWLVLRCSTLGCMFGAFPGIGGSVIDWLAYGHCVQTEKPSDRPFGSGDVRGVIAPESANNAKEGGALIPTVVFGVPGSASMALLLGAFTMHGLTPGPTMLTRDLSFTYSLVWSIALANVLGAVTCFLLSGYFAKIATLRYTLVLPPVLCIAFIGAFQASRAWGDIYALLFFCVLGWIMKRLQWPRPPLVLGFILGGTVERYLFISIARYEWEWLLRPAVAVLFALALLALFGPLVKDLVRRGGLKGMRNIYGAPKLGRNMIFPAVMFGVVAVMLVEASEWRTVARIVPQIVGGLALLTFGLALLDELLRDPVKEAAVAASDARIHMDLKSDSGDLSSREVLRRAGVFLLWLLGLAALVALVGMIPAIFIFTLAFMRVMNREHWALSLGMATALAALALGVFDQLMNLPWPPTLLGSLIPALQVFPSV